MARELETMQDGFQALQTGYGILGAVDYARFPVSSVPQLSLSGDKLFTIFTTLCFRNVQGGILFEQPDLFFIGIMDGQLYGLKQHVLLFCKVGHIRITKNLFKEKFLCAGEILFVPLRPRTATYASSRWRMQSAAPISNLISRKERSKQGKQ